MLRHVTPYSASENQLRLCSTYSQRSEGYVKKAVYSLTENSKCSHTTLPVCTAWPATLLLEREARHVYHDLAHI